MVAPAAALSRRTSSQSRPAAIVAASWLGKAKTVLQIAAVIALIATNPAPAWVDALVYVALAATVISGADYFFGLRRRIEALERERAAAKAKPAA